MNPIVKVERLRKTYGATVAVDEVTFDIQEGEIFGMIGPNGAGKTTTIECLEGLRKPDSGTVSVLGVDPQRNTKFLHTRTGMQLQQSNLPERMKVWEALDLYSSFYPKAADWKELLQQLGLEEKRNTPFSKLSGGQKQRLFIALALLPDPQLLFLDELTTGLDPHSRVDLWDLIRQLVRDGTTLLLTTQHLDEADALSKEIAVIDDGRVIANGTPDELKDKVGGTVLDVRVDREHLAEAADALYGIACGGQQVVNERSETTLPVGTDGPAALTEAVRRPGAVGVTIADLACCKPTLNDVFLALTGRAVAKTTAGDGGAGEDGSDEPGRRKRRRVRKSR